MPNNLHDFHTVTDVYCVYCKLLFLCTCCMYVVADLSFLQPVLLAVPWSDQLAVQATVGPPSPVHSHAKHVPPVIHWWAAPWCSLSTTPPFCKPHPSVHQPHPFLHCVRSIHNLHPFSWLFITNLHAYSNVYILRYIHNLMFINILVMFISISWLYVIHSMDTTHVSPEPAHLHCIIRMYDFSLPCACVYGPTGLGLTFKLFIINTVYRKYPRVSLCIVLCTLLCTLLGTGWHAILCNALGINSDTIYICTYFKSNTYIRT